MEKKKLDEFTKVKLVYSGELAIFAVVFLVLGILKITGVLGSGNMIKRWILLVLSLAGAVWFVVDLVWAIASKKHRAKVSMIDKIIVMPASIALVAFDIYALVQGVTLVPNEIYSTFYAIIFFYFAGIYIFQAIYHYFYPVPLMQASLENLKVELEKLENEEKAEENGENPEKPENDVVEAEIKEEEPK